RLKRGWSSHEILPAEGVTTASDVLQERDYGRLPEERRCCAFGMRDCMHAGIPHNTDPGHGAVMRLTNPRLPLVLAALLTTGVAPLAGQQRLPLDEEYGRQILEYTTDSLFLPASVATLPAHPVIPSPKDHFGTIAGAPGVMHHA